MLIFRAAMDARNDGAPLSPELYQTHSLSTNFGQLLPEQAAALVALNACLACHPLAEAHADYLSDQRVLVRHLIARRWNVDRAHVMALEALAWREKRPAHRWFAAGPPPGHPKHAEAARWAALFKRHATLGKTRVAGTDASGRAVLVIDASRENSRAPEEITRFFAWNLELCARTMQAAHARSSLGPCPDKIAMFVHMSDFSLWDQPSFEVLCESVHIISTVHEA